MKTILRGLGVTLGVVFLSFAAIVAWPDAMDSGNFDLFDILAYVVISGYFIFYGVTGESSLYQYFNRNRSTTDDADT